MAEEINTNQAEVTEDVKKKNYKGKTFVISLDYIARYDVLKDKHQLSDSKMFDLMLSKLENQADDNQSAVSEQVDKYKEEITSLNEKINSLNETIENLQLELQDKNRDVEKYYNRTLEYELEVNKLSTDLSNVDRENGDLQSKVNEVNNGNNVIVRMQEPERKLLDEVLKRLSERQNIDITKSDYFRVIFLRYNIERWSEWFHKFVLTDRDIETITGVSKKDWLKFLNK